MSLVLEMRQLGPRLLLVIAAAAVAVVGDSSLWSGFSASSVALLMPPIQVGSLI